MRARISTGSAWVDSDLAGAVQYGSQRVTFGPPSGGGTVDEYLTLPNPLSSSDWADSNTNVACRWATSVAASWVGVRYWRPPTYSAGGSVFGVNNDTNAIITEVVPEAVDGLRGAFVSLMFATPVAVVPGVNYLAAYHTSRYGFSRVTDGATLPFLSPSGRIYTDPSAMAAVAFYRFGAPASGVWTASPNFHYNVSPIVRYPA